MMGHALRIGTILLALLAPFFFPYPVTLILSFVGGVIFSPLSIIVGVSLDLLYGTSVLPVHTLIGCGIALVTFFVRRFIKARIMTA